MPAIKTLVRHNGPLPQGQARGVIQGAIRTMKADLGTYLVTRVQERLDTVLVHPTGHYRGQIDYLVNQGNGAVIVHDRGVVYGPWLEGTGSRNASSRFKGYRTFRLVMQETQSQIDQVATPSIKAACKELS